MPSLVPGEVAFVYTNKLSSSTYRGLMVARPLNQSYVRCGEELDGQLKIVVHLKVPCVSALAYGRHHIIDHIDALPDKYVAFRRLQANFSAQIFNTDEHLREQCCTRICAVIPHHCNLPCATDVDRRARRTVGLIGWTQASLGIREALRASGLKVDTEPKGRWHTFGYGSDTGRPAEICRFFDRLGVAIAWNDELERQRITRA